MSRNDVIKAIGAVAVAAVAFSTSKRRILTGNVYAFSEVIRQCEGAAYNVLFGGARITDFSKHPNKCVPFRNPKTGKNDCSTAAGKYQYLYSTWRQLAAEVGVHDFTEESQDVVFLHHLKKLGILPLVQKGDFFAALSKAAPIWASLPESPYKQPVRTREFCLNLYKKYGGSVV